MKGFPRRTEAVLQELLRVWSPERFVVVGAAAVGYHTGLWWRGTIDLDLSISADVDAYTRDLESLNFKRDRALPQRWLSPGGFRVDVIPATPVLIAEGDFVWPDGSRISLVGFRLAFADAELVELSDGASLRVASLKSLVVLKMSSYLDRPLERDNDLGDIAHILREFVTADDDARWSLEVADLNLHYDDVSPYLLGKQIGSAVNETESALVRRFLGAVEEPSDRLATLTRMARIAPEGLREPKDLKSRIATFQRGFES